MIEILHLNPQPFHFTPFLNAGRNGGTVRERLPWLRGTVAALPAELDALLVTSDLRERGVSGPPRPLVGEVVAAEYMQHCAAWGLPQPERVGVLLAGDYYAAPAADKRGATGNVFPSGTPLLMLSRGWWVFWAIMTRLRPCHWAARCWKPKRSRAGACASAE